MVNEDYVVSCSFPVLNEGSNPLNRNAGYGFPALNYFEANSIENMIYLE